jgi:hypothetical protein
VWLSRLRIRARLGKHAGHFDPVGVPFLLPKTAILSEGSPVPRVEKGLKG